MKKTLLVVSAVAAACGLGFYSLCHHDTKAAAAASSTGLSPRDPVHAMFLGCQKGCGSTSAENLAHAQVQPVALGELTFCPVSGAVFRVTDQSTRREVGGTTLYFCCDACAGYFDANRAEVLEKRGLAT